MRKISMALPFILATTLGVAVNSAYAQGMDPYPVKGQIPSCKSSFGIANCMLNGLPDFITP